jgi:hypothetical protein
MAELSSKTLTKLDDYVEIDNVRAHLTAKMEAAIHAVMAQYKPQIDALDKQTEAITDSIPESQEDEFYAQELEARKMRYDAQSLEARKMWESCGCADTLILHIHSFPAGSLAGETLALAAKELAGADTSGADVANLELVRDLRDWQRRHRAMRSPNFFTGGPLLR